MCRGDEAAAAHTHADSVQSRAEAVQRAAQQREQQDGAVVSLLERAETSEAALAAAQASLAVACAPFASCSLH